MIGHDSRAVTWSPENTAGLSQIYLCNNLVTRLRGAFFRRNFLPHHGVLLRRCSSVHSFGLGRSLVAIFLDKDDQILSIQTLYPNQVRSCSGAKSVLELNLDCLFMDAVKVGDQLDFGSLLKRSSRLQCLRKRQAHKAQTGASMVEFLIVAPIIIYLGVGIVQMGLVYHARNVVDYATFEAARTGAVHQADLGEMRRELIYRLGPVFGGDGSASGVRRAVQSSILAVNDPLRTQIRVINPTAAAFEDFGVVDPDTGETVLPNAHLQHRSTQIGQRSGVTIQDANLLKIEVTHGYELKLPWFDIKLPGADFALRQLMVRADPSNAVFYSRGQIPIRAVATVRMQSKAIVNNVTVPGPGGNQPQTETAESIASNPAATANEAAGDEASEEAHTDPAVSEDCLGPHGLPNNLAIESLADDEALAQCAVLSDTGVGSSPTVPSTELVQTSLEC